MLDRVLSYPEVADDLFEQTVSLDGNLDHRDRDMTPSRRSSISRCWRVHEAAPGKQGRMGLKRAELVALYERYLTCCNERRFDELGEFVSDRVGGSGAVDGLVAYIDRVKAPCTAFPDYRWELKEVLVEKDTIAARLIGRGTHTGPFGDIAPTGRTIRVQELVIYRFAQGKIVQCWGDLFPVVRDALTAPDVTD